jgi:hypothetical protein
MYNIKQQSVKCNKCVSFFIQKIKTNKLHTYFPKYADILFY